MRMGREGLEWEAKEINVEAAVRLGTDERMSLFEDRRKLDPSHLAS